MGRNAPPTIRRDATVLTHAVDQLDMWGSYSMFGNVDLYYNPIAHGQESLELMAQVIEKEGTDSVIDLLKGAPCGCCRMDVFFEIGGFKVRGATILREDFENLRIMDFIIPGETFEADCIVTAVQTPFCCC